MLSELANEETFRLDEIDLAYTHRLVWTSEQTLPPKSLYQLSPR